MAREWEFIKQTNFWGKSEYVLLEKEPNDGCGCLIGLLIIVGILLALFSFPYKLVDNTFSPFEYNWLKHRDVWVFSLSTWVSILMIATVIRTSIKNKGNSFEYIFGTPFITLGLFTLSLSTFIGYFIKIKYPEHFSSIFLVFGILILGIVFSIIKSADFQKRIWVIIFAIVLTIVPYIYLNAYAKIPYALGTITDNEIQHTEKKAVLFIISNNGANIRKSPSITSEIIFKLSYSTEIYFASDSTQNSDIIWYKIVYNGTEGWINKNLVKFAN